MLWKAEQVFSHFEQSIRKVKNVKSILAKKSLPETMDYTFPPCHSFKQKALAKFLKLCIHIACKKMIKLATPDTCAKKA